MRFLLHFIPRADQRELIREDLGEELSRRREGGEGRPGIWYLGAVLESVADWWLSALRVRAKAGRPSAGARRIGLRSGGVLMDVRFALRMIRREKIVSGAVILTVLIGVGATTAVATLLRGVLMRPLPYPDGDQIVRLSRTNDGEPAAFPVVGLLDLEDWRSRSTAATAIAGWSANAVTLTGDGTAERVSVALVTVDMDRVLGINPSAGRFFVPEDFDVIGGNVAVLSHAFWTDRFGGDRSVIGSSIDLDARSIQVVGVLPPTELSYPPRADLWLPLAPAPDSWMRTVRGSSWLNAVARLTPGLGLVTAEREFSRVQQALASEFPRQDRAQNGVRAERLKDVIVAPARPAIRVMTASIALVLLLASINVGLLLLARSNRRRQELSVRTALGGDRVRLGRLILTEALVLSAIGGALGVPLAFPLVDATVALYPGGLPRAAEISFDGWVVAASLLTIFMAGGMASLAPAASLRKLDLASQLRLRDGGPDRRQTRVRTLLVGAQLALSAVLLVGASLLAQTLANLRQADPGFDPTGVLTFNIAPAASAYPYDEAVTAFYQTLLTELNAIPGVSSVGGVSFLPFTGGEWGGGFLVGGETHEARVRQSWPGYYDALGLKLLEGRVFDWRDDSDGAQVAMLNEQAAHLAFGEEDPVGRQIVFEGETREVVGMLKDVRHRSLLDPTAPEVHIPTAQVSRLAASVVMRTDTDPLALVPAIRRIVSGIDPDIPLTGIALMGDRIEASIAAERFRATLVTGLGGLSALLALIGVYGAMSYAVLQRRREIGIRFALGERGGSICARVLRSAGALSVAGVGVGLALAWAASRWLESLLYGVSAQEPSVFLAVAGVLVLAGTVSSVGPALKAGRTDPLLTLREE